MLPDRVLNPAPLTYESGAIPIALRANVDKRCLYFLQDGHRRSLSHAYNDKISILIITRKYVMYTSCRGEELTFFYSLLVFFLSETTAIVLLNEASF